MSEPSAQRTLVKSPPELWAEVSDVESLARHLGEFGEIRITRVEPETTVVWEGERASGTVELEPSGWGTKVTLTATPVEQPAPEPATVGPHSAADGRETQPTAVEVEPATAKTEGEAEAEPEPATVGRHLAADGREMPPTAAESEPAASAPAPMTANEVLARSGFFARVFKRRKGDPQGETGGPMAPEPAPPAPVVVPVPEPEPEPEPQPEPLPEPTPLPTRAPDPEPPAAARAQAPLDVEAVLTGVLDTLGAAHHRPFSR